MTLKIRIPGASLLFSEGYTKNPESTKKRLEDLESLGLKGTLAQKLAGSKLAEQERIETVYLELRNWVTTTKYPIGEIVEVMSSPGYALLGGGQDRISRAVERIEAERKKSRRGYKQE
ncbi:MAG TPA: hypothetical protein PLK34_02780 [Candidatus Pacearchaeota archaeon]|nr:hypothetical protein [Candidatus Pacearchaeota archaeon]